MIQLNASQIMPQFPVSSTDGLPMDPVNLPVSTRNKHMAEFESMVGAMGSQQYLPNNMQRPMHMMLTDQVHQKQLLSHKRKSSADGAASKKRVQVGSLSTSPRLSQPSVPNKRIAQQGSMPNTPRSGNSGKKVVQIEPAVSKSLSSATRNRNSGQTEVSPKSQMESSDSVRSKLRESLAAALSLVSQQQEDFSAVDKKNQGDPAIMDKELEDPKPSETISSTADPAIPDSEKALHDHNHVNTSGDVHSKDIMGDATNSWEFVGHDFQSDAVLHVEDASFSDSFFVKDDLLLGNGLSWVMDLDENAAGVEQVEPDQDPKLMNADVGVGEKQQAVVPMESISRRFEPTPESLVMHEDADVGEKEQAGLSAQSVALKIELELFKLYGSVNKKYKEKGRSLLFNLKDRNNPELRERVMSGEIPPEKLCSMTAEELASKELSQWRIAKAEELAQMKVLPDVEVDIRRLVRKTHKGEFQVEFEQDIAALVDVPVNTSLPSGSESPSNASEITSTDTVSGVNNKVDAKSEIHSSRNQDDEYKLTIPTDGADMMQGLMEDDTRDLPPILSLDEFMESLDKEPPFDNLPINSGKTGSFIKKDISEAGTELKLSDKALKDPVEKEVQKTEEVKSKILKPDADMKPISSQTEPKYPVTGIAKAERVWDGLVQLNTSFIANIVGMYKSGEKAITKEWLNLFEVKGRVRLDAFEKYLHALPMSRSRAMMVAHFALKDGSTDSDHANLQEMVDSYVVESRVGFAEPAPGVELYLCPPRKGTLDMLSKHLTENYTEKLDAIENGFIGIVVWRKVPLTSAVSPKPSQQHKDESASRHQPFSSRRHQEQEVLVNANVKSASKPAPPHFMSKPAPVADDDDDDVPPGFGPPVAREDDDLPEFSFSGGSQFPRQNAAREPEMGKPLPPAQAPSRPVEKMRELIKKYGQSGNNVVASGIVLEPWNDDDDIPEWQPEARQQRLPSPTPQQTFCPSLPQPVLHPHFANQQPPMMPLVKPVQQPFQSMQPFQPLQPPIAPLQNGAQWQQGAWWTPSPPSMQQSNLGNHLIGGQFPGRRS
ncbi:hypothetical protein Dimus_010351 [Dionaea muscipula]